MKRTLLIIFGLVCLCIAGCGKSKKELICTYNSDEGEDGVYSIKYVIDYDNNGSNMKKVKFTANDTYGTTYYTKEEIDEYAADYEEDCILYENYNGATCNVNYVDNVVTQEINIDIDKLSDEEVEELLGISRDKLEDYDNFKESMTKYGYVCE